MKRNIEKEWNFENVAVWMSHSGLTLLALNWNSLMNYSIEGSCVNELDPNAFSRFVDRYSRRVQKIPCIHKQV